MRRLLIMLCLMCCAINAQAERVALVIGNANYQVMPALQGPIHDASDVEAEFRKLGFRIIGAPIGKNANTDLRRAQMLERIQTFEQQAQGAELAVLYFSGHGALVGDQQFLLPVDLIQAGNVFVQDNGVPLKLAIDALARAQVKSALIVIDACRDQPGTRGATRGLQDSRPPQLVNFLIAFSASVGKPAEDIGSNHRNSPYTQMLLQELQKNPMREVEAVFKAVRIGVMQQTNNAQIPEEASKLTQEVWFAVNTAVHKAPGDLPSQSFVGNAPSGDSLAPDEYFVPDGDSAPDEYFVTSICKVPPALGGIECAIPWAEVLSECSCEIRGNFVGSLSLADAYVAPAQTGIFPWEVSIPTELPSLKTCEVRYENSTYRCQVLAGAWPSCSCAAIQVKGIAQ
jgi:hypothetical protein